MAKTKKKEKIVDLKPQKITEEQLTNVQTTINTLNRLQLEVGMFETRKHRILHEISSVNEELTRIQGELEKEYGTFDININDGVINYPKENGEVNKKD
jgi:predicted transcriptional regulator